MYIRTAVLWVGAVVLSFGLASSGLAPVEEEWGGVKVELADYREATLGERVYLWKPPPEYVLPISPRHWEISSWCGGWRAHKGLDIAVKTGTKAYAAHEGKVVYAGWYAKEANYGRLVIIKYGNVTLWYAHLYKIRVKVGQKVKAGDVVALTGNTGYSTGPHLHFGVKIDGKFVDPYRWLKKHVSKEEW
jgi:murein DD-endopeptidase MepM/ murein hydrolase activator NlpD